jgi:arylsulfatase A-like enzyme
MLDILEENEELDNIIIVLTSDNGMPFPILKGLNYEHSNQTINQTESLNL